MPGKKTPEVIEEIKSILEVHTGGDPMTGTKWSRKAPAKVADCLNECCIRISASTVRRILLDLGYSLKGNKKSLSSGSSPYRDRQFHIIARYREQFTSTKEPIISVDTKKKELVGLFKNPGQTWCRYAAQVKDHDFRSEAVGIAAPYGIYDVTGNTGFLVIGNSADTPEFAVNSIATWWEHHGKKVYPGAQQLLILADAGGSNGARPRAFKKFLQDKIVDEYGLTVRVCHYPPGASKWNPVEHRMFSEITKNWAGQPLETFETLRNYAAGTRTETGLSVEAYLDANEYQKGIRINEKEFRNLNFRNDEELGKWNYTIAHTVKPEVMISLQTPKATSQNEETRDKALQKCELISV